MTSADKSTAAPVDERRRYFNRELSWLKFNERVLEEALDEDLPLLERVKFLSIFCSNLDEFFMIRVSGLRRQLQSGVVTAPPDKMTPAEQLDAIRAELLPLIDKSYRCWSSDLMAKLRATGIRVLRYEQLKTKQAKLLRRYFKREIFPVLTPLASDPGHPFPHISNLSINLAVVVKDPGLGERFARIKVPLTFPRLLRVPDEERAEHLERLGLQEVSAANFVWLEEVIAANLDLLFPGVEVVAVYPFRITRDADMDIEEDEASDLLLAMSEFVSERRFGSAVRLEVDAAMPNEIEEILLQNLELQPYQVYRSPSPIGIADTMQLCKIERPELKFRPFKPVVQSVFSQDEDIFTSIRRRNILLYHPYDSFSPVVRFVRDASVDPRVLAIKQTLYRTGPNSPIISALMQARENGKQVAVLVELKARFDEENNITWARALERAGVHVVYGVLGLKTHCKLSMVVRRDRDRIRRYVHMATGNYNPVTARLYTDFGHFTCDDKLADDVSDLFNALTGISRKNDYRKLLVAPVSMRTGLLDRIRREVDAHHANGNGHIILKANSLTDKPIINALYEASETGVRVDLQIRGICCLRPGVPGLSESISVTSIVGRFLEHTRAYWFANNGNPEILLGSADLMGRNLDRRMETLFPVEDPRLLKALHEVLLLHLGDTAKLWQLQADGRWLRTSAGGQALGAKPLMSTQRHLVEQGGPWRLDED